MKQVFWMMITVLFMSCNAPKKSTSIEKGNKHVFPPYKSELYFENCNDVVAFLKSIIVNKRADNSLELGHFKIPHINAAYANAKAIIPASCFVGMTTNELETIFGVGSYDGDFIFWYFLEYRYANPMSIEVFHKNGIVQKFILHQTSIQVGPGK